MTTSSLGKQVAEGIQDKINELSVDITDGQLKQAINRFEAIGASSMQKVLRDFKINKKYYLGQQLDIEDGVDVVDNRIFLSLETIVPIATSSTPVPNVLPFQNEIEVIEKAKSWEKILMNIYNRKRMMQKRMERAVRHLSLAKFAVLKYLYDPETEEITTRIIHPDRCVFDNNRDVDDDLDWFGERITTTAEDLVKRFAKDDKELKKKIEQLVDKKMSSTLTYTEWWTPDVYAAKIGDIILRKAKNPNWNYKNPKKNFFKKRKVPYIIVNLFDLGESIAGSTALIEQSKALQDNINKRKTQIQRNADLVNGKAMCSGASGIKKSEFEGIDWSDPRTGIYFKDGDMGDIKRESGQPLPQFVQIDMDDSRAEIDNIMGTHSTTRGEREGRETAKGRVLLRESDTGRIDVIGRRLEEAIQQLFEGWTQLVSVYFGKKRLVTILNEDKTREFLEYDGGIVDGIKEIEVIPGSLIPMDKASRQERSLVLANAQMIDPISLYREFGMKNPEQMAKNLYLWQNDPMRLFEDLKDEMAGEDEGDAQNQIRQANEENAAMAQGEPIPPFENANANHLAAHEQFMSQPEFAQLSQEIKQLFLDHVRAEAEIVQTREKERL